MEMEPVETRNVYGQGLRTKERVETGDESLFSSECLSTYPGTVDADKNPSLKLVSSPETFTDFFIISGNNSKISIINSFDIYLISITTISVKY